MKNITTAILFALIALTTACGPAGEPTNDWTGTYSGTATTSGKITSDVYQGGPYSDIGDARFTITESDTGSLLLSDGSGCLILGDDMGDHIVLNGMCVVTDEAYGERLTQKWSGEAYFTPSGKLQVEANVEGTLEGEYQYNHGFEWEVDGQIQGTVSFNGRKL